MSLFANPAWKEAIEDLYPDEPEFLIDILHAHPERFAAFQKSARNVVNAMYEPAVANNAPSSFIFSLTDEELFRALCENARVMREELVGPEFEGRTEDELRVTLTYSLCVTAYCLEALRTPLAWRDLNERERRIIQPAYAACGVVTPDETAPFPRELSFLVLWSRGRGELPAWLQALFSDESAPANAALN